MRSDEEARPFLQRVVGRGPRADDGSVTEATADAWIAAWEAQAARDRIERGSAYWEAGRAWIATQREKRVRP